jgi:hypothetical protein
VRGRSVVKTGPGFGAGEGVGSPLSPLTIRPNTRGSQAWLVVQPVRPGPPKRRRLIVIVIAVIVIVLVVTLALLYVPLESTTFAQTAETKDCSGSLGPCPTMAIEYTVGDGKYATLTGTWVTNVSGDNVFVTINNGPESGACALCADSLYSSEGSMALTGSFDVSGSGAFHISVNQIGFDSATTTVQGTVDSAVL